MENKIEIFKNEKFGEVRWANINNKDYAVAKDIATALGYKNTNDVIIRHCKRVVKHEGFKINGTEVSLIPEGDIYRLIARSELPEAEKFEMWIFDEVLPSIRKHGIYITEELLKDKEKLQYEIDKIQNEYYELEHKANDSEIDNNILKAEKEDLKDKNIKMLKEREAAFKLSLKTHEKETYLPNLTIQAIRYYINNNKNVILDEDEEGFYIKLSLLVKELKKLILNNGDRLYVLCSLGINISDKVSFIPREFMNEDYEVTGISYL